MTKEDDYFYYVYLYNGITIQLKKYVIKSLLALAIVSGLVSAMVWICRWCYLWMAFLSVSAQIVLSLPFLWTGAFLS